MNASAEFLFAAFAFENVLTDLKGGKASKMGNKLKKLWIWLRKEILNKRMTFWLLIAVLIFWSPAIVFAILAIFLSSWYWALFWATVAFWAGPFTPAMPLQIGLAYGLKKLYERIKCKKNS